MKVRVCSRSIWVPAPLAEVFEFFSNAANLKKLTPPWLDFEVLTPEPIEMAPGALIDYRIKIRGIPVRWRTEITEWVPGERFADRQLKGPYKQWIHTHSFREENGGTRIDDLVEYIVPGGIFEPLVYPIVRRDVERIFDYRGQVVAELFAKG